VYLVSFDFYCPLKCGSYFCHTLYKINTTFIKNGSIDEATYTIHMKFWYGLQTETPLYGGGLFCW